MKIALHKLFGFSALLASCASSARSDTLVMLSDRTVTGTVLQTNGDNVVLLTDFGTLNYSRAIIKEIKIERAEAVELENPNRLPEYRSVIRLLSGQPWASNLKQIPATVIDQGIMKSVPYMSFRCGEDYEVNVYGDPDHPSGIEAGVYRKLLTDGSAKANCIRFVGDLLGQPGDKQILGDLNLEKDQKTRDGFTFEVTPPSAEDAYNGWWVSVYCEKGLDSARATDEEIRNIAISKAEAAKEGGASRDPASWSKDDLKLARPSMPTLITFTDSSGTIISDAEVVRVNDGVSVTWRKGASGGVVKLADLPADLRARFGYDPGKAAAAAEAEKAQAAAKWQQNQAELRAVQGAQPNSTTFADTDSGYTGDYSGGSTARVRSHSSGGGSVYVRDYYRKDGTYVHGYTRRR